MIHDQTDQTSAFQFADLIFQKCFEDLFKQAGMSIPAGLISSNMNASTCSLSRYDFDFLR